MQGNQQTRWLWVGYVIYGTRYKFTGSKFRHQVNCPLAQTQLFQRKLADIQTEITLGVQASLRVGRRMDEVNATPEMISIIKRNNCGKALDIASRSRDMHGGNDIGLDFHPPHDELRDRYYL